MGTLVKRIQKRVDRFQIALNAVEKAFAEEQEKQNFSLPQSFNLAGVASAELEAQKKEQRKQKNKRKAKRRELKK